MDENYEEGVADVFGLDKLTIAEQIERLDDEVEALSVPLMTISELLSRLKVAAEQGLLSEQEQESLFMALVRDVINDDLAWLGLREENRDAIFDLLPDLAHTLPDNDDVAF